MMQPIRDLCTHPLQWSYRGIMRRDIELIAGTEIVATLLWTGWFGSLCEARAADGAWTFEHAGFFGGGVLVRDGNGHEIAEYQSDWLGEGTLTFPSGLKFTWRGEGFWRRDWLFLDAAGRELVRCRKTSGFVGGTDEVLVAACARPLPQLALLILLSRYLLTQMEAASASASASGALPH